MPLTSPAGSISVRVAKQLSLLIMLLLSARCGLRPSHAPGDAKETTWEHFAGTPGGTRYSSLTLINAENVGHLQLVWAVRTGDFPADVFDAKGHRAGGTRPDGTAIEPRPGAPCGHCHEAQFRSEATPIMVEGTLYVTTPRNRVLALDPSTGATRWTFDPQLDLTRRYVEDFVSRGVLSWRDSGGAREACGQRLFLATIDARLFALDAADGTLCPDFGESGMVRLDPAVGTSGRAVDPGQHAVTSPPAVVGDIVIVGSAVGKNQRRDGPSGVVQAFDARSGEPRWTFDPIPRTPAHPGWRYWTPEAALTTGGANSWSIITTDPPRDLVFLPTASAAPDSYGGERPGRNDFASSVVALRASTGQVVWSFQVVHHDLWDYDVAAQPMLIELRRGGEPIPAVLIGTKAGTVFVLHRETGEPLVPVEERPVPPSDVPGETAWPTQPFSELPALHSTVLTADSVFGVSQADREFCRDWVSRVRNEGLFTPPSLQGTLLWPGYWGGINWDGMAWDPAGQLLITTVKRFGMVVQLHRRDNPAGLRGPPALGQQLLAQEGTPYLATRTPFVSPSGTPCSPPPWGILVAVDIAQSSIRWHRPLGTVPWLATHPDYQNWGSIPVGGPLVTGGGIVFVAASQDDRFRAFDVRTGAVLWEAQLPAGGQAAPMTYLFEGRQYVVLMAGGRGGIGSPGDWIVAFALPRELRRSQ